MYCRLHIACRWSVCLWNLFCLAKLCFSIQRNSIRFSVKARKDNSVSIRQLQCDSKQCPERWISTTSENLSVSKANHFHVVIFGLFVINLRYAAGSTDSSKTIGNLAEVLNFNWLFLRPKAAHLQRLAVGSPFIASSRPTRHPLPKRVFNHKDKPCSKCRARFPTATSFVEASVVFGLDFQPPKSWLTLKKRWISTPPSVHAASLYNFNPSATPHKNGALPRSFSSQSVWRMV